MIDFSEFVFSAGQIGLVPKNYLIELSQYLTQDVNKSSNGSGTGKFFKKFCAKKIIQKIIMIYFYLSSQ